MELKVFGLCAVLFGTKADEPLQTRTERHVGAMANVEHNLKLEKGDGEERWLIDGKLRKKREQLQGKSARNLGNNLQTKESWHNEGLWNITKKRILEDRGALPQEEDDLIRECKAIHKENLSSWLRGRRKRKAVVWRESGDTQEYGSCQRNDLDVDMDETKEELSFTPIPVTSTAGWYEHQWDPVLRNCTSDG